MLVFFIPPFSAFPRSAAAYFASRCIHFMTSDAALCFADRLLAIHVPVLWPQHHERYNRDRR